MGRKKTTISCDIIELYKQGYSCKDICIACNTSPVTVRNHLQAAGFDTRRYRKVSENNRNKVIMLIKAGYPYNQIGNLLQISTHLIREIVESSGLVGFAPKNYLPVKLTVRENEVSTESIRLLQQIYRSGKFGLAKCAAQVKVSDKEFLWFVFHLTSNDKHIHNKNLHKNIHKMYENNTPLMAIAKQMDISPALVKKIID